METLFVLSAVVVINYMVVMLGAMMGNEVGVPAPVIHLFGWSYSNTYVTSPAIGYQVYFWATYAGVL